MEGAVEKVARSNLTRIEIITESIQEECVENCNGVWLRMAEQVLRNNKLHPFVFAEALKTLKIKGLGKHRNVIVIGPANCGKTFLFRFMEKLFKVFCNPAEYKYAWVKVVDAEMIFLSDFRWCKEMISWKEMLLLLEGQPVHFPAPKNHYWKDVCLLSDTPVVATSKSRVVFERNGKSGEVENEMMKARWKVFEFTHQIPYHEQKEVEPCGRWFSELVLLGEIWKGCFLLILYFSLELQRVTRVTPRVTPCATPKSP